jgi:hypothetical protein
MDNSEWIVFALGVSVFLATINFFWTLFFKEKHKKKRWNEIIDTMKMEVNRTEVNKLLKIEKHNKIINGIRQNEYILFDGNHAICQVNSKVIDALLYEDGCENLINCTIVCKNILCNGKIIRDGFDLYRLFGINRHEYMISASNDCIEKFRWIESITYYQGDVLYQNFESNSLKIEQAKHKLRDMVKCVKKSPFAG